METFAQLVARCQSKSEICRELDLPINGKSLKNVGKMLEGMDTSHFTKGSRRKYPLITKICPVCGTEFQTSKGSPKEQMTCSYSCSNTYFRSGENNPNWKEPGTHLVDSRQYRSICFSVYPERCILCGWDLVVEVHHIDGDHDNNDISNLVPLCPNHHKAIHTLEYGERFKAEVEEAIRRFR